MAEEVRPEQRRPTTANCDSQYVAAVRSTSNVEPSTTRCRAGSKSVPMLRWKSMIQRTVVKGREHVAVGGAPRELVREREADPDRELEGEMGPPARQATGESGGVLRHPTAILTGGLT